MRRALAFTLLAAAACSDDLKQVANTDVVVDSPADGATAFTLDPLLFKVTATNPVGIAELVLHVGERELHSCEGGEGPDFETVTCAKSFDVREFAGQQKDGKLALRVTVTDGQDGVRNESLEVVLKPVKVSFLKPAITQQSPPLARLGAGVGPLALEVRSEVPLESVRVTFDDGIPLTDFANAPYERDIEWGAFVGAGAHRLTAEATDVQSRTDTATLDVLVTCGSNGDCPSGERCCVSSGTCIEDAPGSQCPAP